MKPFDRVDTGCLRTKRSTYRNVPTLRFKDILREAVVEWETLLGILHDPLTSLDIGQVVGTARLPLLSLGNCLHHCAGVSTSDVVASRELNGEGGIRSI